MNNYYFIINVVEQIIKIWIYYFPLLADENVVGNEKSM